jgi:hypothetical protein
VVIIIFDLNVVFIDIIHVLVHQLVIGFVIIHVEVVSAISLQEYVIIGVLLGVRSTLFV